MCGSKKLSMSSFFFGTLIFGALLFLAQCLARKKYEFLFFGTHTFLEPILCLAPKSMNFFFWGTFFLELIHFFCWNLGTHTFFDVMFGPKKYESCPFPELLVFFCCDFLMNKMFGFLRDAFFSGTLDSKYLCC